MIKYIIIGLLSYAAGAVSMFHAIARSMTATERRQADGRREET